MAHEHNVIDSDKHFKIDPTTREIINESGKVTLMQHDHNSERFTFEAPRYVDGHDMSLCNLDQMHYQNKEIATDTTYDDVYEVSDFKVDTADDSIVTFSWLISGNATQYVGPLNFSARFACVADDGTVEYAWNTAAHYGITVSSCFYNSEAVAVMYYDVLALWHNDLYLASVGKGVTPEEVCKMLGAVVVKTASVALPASAWVNGSQTVTLNGVTADEVNCHVYATYQTGSYEQWRDSYVRLSSQGNGTLTFACEADVIPTADIVMNVAIYYGT